MITTRNSSKLLLFLLLLAYGVGHGSEPLYFIDAHSQVDHQVVPLDKIISLMDQSDVRHTILSSRGNLKGKELFKLSAKYKGKITPAIRTKGESYETGSPKYYNTLQSQVTSGKFSAIAEVLFYHAQKGNKAPEYMVFPEDKRVQEALKYAIAQDWPFVVHIEFGALKGPKKKRFMKSFRKMLNSNSQHPFVLTHMGQLPSYKCRLLIENHDNIFFHTGWSNPAAVNSSKQPWVNLFEGEVFAPEWLALFTQYPDRFIFALDNVFAEHWSDFYKEQMTYWKAALEVLPEDAAHLIAHGNAERLWNLQVSK